MSAIDFVVRDSAGNLERGAVAAEGAQSSIVVGSGEDVSLNLRRAQIAEYGQQGEALQITLIDGRVIVVDGFFSADGVAENQLFVSADGQIAAVELVGGEAGLFGLYETASPFGKWSPNDDLYFMRGNDVMIAAPMIEDSEDIVGMAAAPLFGGLSSVGSLLGFGGAGSAALVGGALLAGGVEDGTVVSGGGSSGGSGTGGGSTNAFGGTSSGPGISVVSSGQPVNEADRADGVDIAGTGTPGGVVDVVIGQSSQQTTVDESGDWQVTFPASDIPGGTYSEDVIATITGPDGDTATTTEVLIVDTLTQIGFSTATTEGDGTVNRVERDDGVELTGTSEPGASVVISVGGMDYPATVDAAGDWIMVLPASALPDGEYAIEITATTTDEAGNTAQTTQSLLVDTETIVALSDAPIEGDGVVNDAERSDGITLFGTAEPGASVAVTMNGHTHSVLADTSGDWTADFAADELPEGEVSAPVSITSTDAAGNTASTTGTVDFDTIVDDFQHASSPVGTDGVLNAEELSQPVVLNGSTEPGSTVQVTLAGVTQQATVDGSGAWTTSFAAGSIPGGEYATSLTISATDAAGNSSQLTENVLIDTNAGHLSLSSAPIEGDDVINAAELSDGVLISGTATPNATVTVSLAGANHQVGSDDDGNWSSVFSSSEVPGGTYTADITAMIEDAAGNRRMVSDSVDVDTEASVAFAAAQVEGDGVINAVEQADGVILTGTAEAGSTQVTVTLGDVSRAANVNPNGSWSAGFAASDLPNQTEATIDMRAVATDRAGNTATTDATVILDNFVNRLAIDAGIEGDDMINAREAQDGVELTGAVEAGSSVLVSFAGTSRAATVDAAGNWTVAFGAGEIPAGESVQSVRITATDAAGNVASSESTLQIDTVLTDAPVITSFTRDSGGDVRRIGTLGEEDSYEIKEVTIGGEVRDVDFTTASPFAGETEFTFQSEVPDGSRLVVVARDEAGNENSTLFVYDESGTNEVDVTNPALAGFDIGAIDLQLAENSEMTLTAQDLDALANTSGELTIFGRADDQVALQGGTATGTARTIDGETYDIYSLGDDGTVVIHEDIQVVI